MLNQSTVTTTKGMTKKLILADTKNRFAVSCKISNASVEAGEGGKKIILAGTPLKGDLTSRETAFQVAASSADPNIVGIALDDVDVTAGDANGNCLIFGFVDESKLDPTVVSKITTITKAKLPLITFIK